MKPQTLFKSFILVTCNLICLVSSQGRQGYRYPVPNRQLQYPKNNPDTFRLDSRERFNNNESDDDLLSNLQGDRDRGRQNGGRSSKQGRRGQSSRSKTGQRGSVPQRELADENYDDNENENLRDRLNNEVLDDQERFLDDGNGNGGTEDRFVEGNEGGLAEGGTTITRRRTSLRNDRDRKQTQQDKRRGSSTNIDEIVTKSKTTQSSGFSNRDLFNKAYNIGRADDEVISGSSQRKKLLESSFRKDVQAPSYSNLSDDDDFEVSNFKTASTTVQKSSVSNSGGAPRSYGGSDDDDDDDFGGGGSASSKNTSLTILGGTFAASNTDQIISRGGNGTTKGSGVKSYYQSDDISGSGSSPSLSLSPTASSSRGGSRTSPNAKRHAPIIDSRATASKPSVKVASHPERAPFSTRQKKQSVAQERVTGSINTGITKTGFICPGGGCILSAASSSTSDGSGLRPSTGSFFPDQRAFLHHPFGGFFTHF